MRKFKIEKIVFGDCISQLLKVKDTGKYDKTEVERKRNKVFDKFFYKSISQKEFRLFKEIIDHQEFYKISIRIKNSEKEIGFFTRLYWFVKKEDDFYFVGMTCIG
ncbi:MAG: hypothetical protein Q4B43_10590 [Bacteroidota bacterium]|nr:hypothetical protein [Bacteroidota bacterium]